VVGRFSQLAGVSVTVLVVTGVYQSWRGLGSVSALTDTTYGRVLLAKLVAVTLLLLAGARSRRTVTRERTARNVTVEIAEKQEAREARVPEPVGGRAESAADGLADGTVDAPAGGPSSPGKPRPPAGAALTPAEDAQRRALRRSVLAEVVVSVVVLVFTTVLTGTLPGRAAAEAATAEQSAGLPVASVTNIPFTIGSGSPGARGVSGKVQVTLDPGRVGDNGLQAVVYGPDGGFVSIPELRISFSLPDQDIGPLDAKVTDRGGYWAADTVNLPLPGTWEMKVTVRVSETDQVSESKPVEIVR
jgi:copper transport protein